MTNDTGSVSVGVIPKVYMSPTVNFRRVREIPRECLPQIEGAIKEFMADSHMCQGTEPNGFISQTLEGLASATFLETPGDELWIGTLGDQLVSFVKATIGKEIDSRLTYQVSQAWVRRDQRRQKWVKEAWERIRTRAKETLCSHMVVISSRNDAAYCRWLGKGWHRYVGLLKEDF